jgi:glutaconate CoA-transferase, subunit A
MNATAIRQSKVVSLSEAAELVPDGARVAFGGLSIYQHPMAFVREVARLERRDLTVVGTLNGPDVDLLAGAGCLARVETSYVGLEQFGLARNFRRLVEAGEVEVVDYSEVLAFDRFRASQDGLSFVAASYLEGTDVLARNPEARELVCPLTGRRYHAFPPADPDVVVLHAAVADEYGNALMPRRRTLEHGLDIILSRACETLILTVERVVSNAFVRSHPELNEVPSFRTTCVVESPFGAHPCSMPGYYDVDDLHFAEYVEAATSQKSFDRYLDRYVRGVDDHIGYLEQIGLRRLLASGLGVGL